MKRMRMMKAPEDELDKHTEGLLYSLLIKIISWEKYCLSVGFTRSSSISFDFVDKKGKHVRAKYDPSIDDNDEIPTINITLYELFEDA